MTSLVTKLKKYGDRLEVRLRKPLPYDFIFAFRLALIIYIISTAFDLLFTYVTFHMTPDHFFQYEFSEIIKMSFAGDKNYQILAFICFILPILICYYPPLRWKKKYGYYIYSSRYYLMILFMGSFMHLFGGLTNFFYLITLKIIQI